MKKPKLPPHLQIWIEVRHRFRLSHAQVQMARELGLNPKKFGKLNNHKQEPWKLPLPQFIEELYFKRFRKKQPDEVIPLEEKVKRLQEKKAARKAARAAEVREEEGQPREEDRKDEGEIIPF